MRRFKKYNLIIKENYNYFINIKFVSSILKDKKIAKLKWIFLEKKNALIIIIII